MTNAKVKDNRKQSFDSKENANGMIETRKFKEENKQKKTFLKQIRSTHINDEYECTEMCRGIERTLFY